MARTQTQKAVRKAQRSGNLAPDFGRKTNEAYGAISQHTRIKPGKQEKLQKLKHKKQILRDDASFLCCRMSACRISA
ncbi:hypothetical protein SK066_06820 [Paenibacillus hunanensis]|uniref:hypothetical protein n=1 Tax=Paenibacillus hunanensis TaxID=539262 RepID=UPI002A6A164F|nr:hypothetical protein [Paenibacillus hunanensis]WPP42646.1 hypothetical protein SK066_06820 [Paenibacillus hunanensis]